MALTRTETISGTMYIAAHDADEAKERAARYLLNNDRDYRVFDDQDDAEREAADMGRYYKPGHFKAFAVTIDVRSTEQ